MVGRFCDPQNLLESRRREYLNAEGDLSAVSLFFLALQSNPSISITSGPGPSMLIEGLCI